MNPERILITAALLLLLASSIAAQTLFPANNAKSVNPDVQLKLTFSQPPVIGKSGNVRIYEAANNRLVDHLDLGIPPGPTERPTGAALTAPYMATPILRTRCGCAHSKQRQHQTRHAIRRR
jgi:hypothetical protein